MCDKKNKFDIINLSARKTLKLAESKGPPTTGRFDPLNRTRLSWWFPKLPYYIPVPQTIIIQHYGEDLLNLLDGKTPIGFSNLCNKLFIAGNRLGWPLFLRTDYLSGKHSWKDTCYVSGPDKIISHITSLVEESEMADILGFPTDCLIARKLIPTKSVFSAFRGEMPITKERRYFVQDDQVVCHHPYWPPAVFKNQQVSVDDWQERLDVMNVESDKEIHLLSDLSSKLGASLGGAWSIDWLWSDDEHKWYLIDMADAAQSYHWPGCPYENNA